MSRFKDNRLKNALIIFLLITNVATVGSFLYVRSKHGNRPPHRPHPEKMMQKFIEDDLGLEGSQRVKFDALRQSFRQEKRTHFQKLKSEMDELLHEFSRGTMDTTVLGAHADRISLIHHQMAHQTIQQYLQTLSLCDEDQKEKLKEMYGKMYERMKAHKGRRGGPGGPGPHGPPHHF